MEAQLKKKVIVGSIIGLVILTGTTLWLRSRKVQKIRKQLLSGSPDILEESKDKEGSVIFPLEKGSGYTNSAENACVKVVQRWLNKKILENPSFGFQLLDEDGKFGTLTENALRRISGVTSVSYSYYKTMQNDLIPVFLKVDVSPDLYPKPDIFDYLKF